MLFWVAVIVGVPVGLFVLLFVVGVLFAYADAAIYGSATVASTPHPHRCPACGGFCICAPGTQSQARQQPISVCTCPHVVPMQHLIRVQ